MCRIPLNTTNVRQLEFHPQFVWIVVRHLVDLFQSQPEVSIVLSESSLIFFPGSVEAHRSIDPLLEHDPVVNMDRRELTEERNRRVDGLIAGDIIWKCINITWLVLKGINHILLVKKTIKFNSLIGVRHYGMCTTETEHIAGSILG